MNQPIRSIIFGASPVQANDVVGLPDWATTERFDITLKPPPGTRPVFAIDHIERLTEN